MGEKVKESQSPLRKDKRRLMKLLCDPATAPKTTGAITTCQLHSTFCVKTDKAQLSQDQQRPAGTSKTNLQSFLHSRNTLMQNSKAQ